MKGITKRKDGRYMIRRTIDNERVTKYARTIAEAKIVYQKLKDGKIRPTKKEKIRNYTLEEYTQIWLNTYKKPFMKERTFQDVRSLTNKFLKELGNYKLKDITSNQIQDFFNKIPKCRTKEKIFTYFKSLFDKAMQCGIVQRTPFYAVIKDKKVKCKNVMFSYNEQIKILKAIKGTDIEHEIYTYLMCGCRPNELPNKNNFDFENNIINVYGTKNDNAHHRQIEMTNAFADYMREYFVKNDMQAEKYVSNKFIKICREENISEPIILYRLRHTFASNHFTLGTQPKIVQQWLGHSSISITLDQYTDIDKTATKQKIIELYNSFYYIP